MSNTLLAVAAHPDDMELSCAGSIARWVQEGARAVLLVATNGARGGKLSGSRAAEIAQVRRKEQEAAAQVIGFEQTLFLGFEDGELRDDESLHETLVRQIRTVRPDTVVMLDPLTIVYENSYVNHRDHRVLGMAMLDAMYPEASNSGYFPQQLESGLHLHKVSVTLLGNTEQPNHWVDVTDTLDVRFSALREHRSQIRLWPHDGESIIAEQRAKAERAAAGKGFTYAESFRRIIANPLT